MRFKLIFLLFLNYFCPVSSQWDDNLSNITTSSNPQEISSTPSPNAPILGYLAVDDGKALGKGEYIRFTDDFQCTDFSYNAFVDCYMSHFGFNHQGSFQFRPPQLSLDKWIIGLEVILEFIKNHTSCDLAAQIAQPETKACGSGEEGLKIEVGEPHTSFSMYSYSVGINMLKVTRDVNDTLRITIDAYGGKRRLLFSQKSGHHRWMRIHCKLCGAWIDIVENCTQRVVHFSTAKSNTRYQSSFDNFDSSAVLPGGANSADYEDKEEAGSITSTTPSSYWLKNYPSYESTQNLKPRLVVWFASNCKQDVRNIVVEQFHRLGLEPPPERDSEEDLSTTTQAMVVTKKQKMKRGDVLVPKGQKYNRKIWFLTSQSNSDEK